MTGREADPLAAVRARAAALQAVIDTAADEATARAAADELHQLLDGVANVDEQPARAAWLLGPAEIAAIAADDELLDRLAAGGQPDESDPLGARLVAWLREVQDGGIR